MSGCCARRRWPPRAAAQARATLDALAPQLAQASSEQRGIAGLLRAQLDRAGGDRNGERAALAQARHEAGRSGVRLLRLQVALQAAEADGRFEPALHRDIDALGHAGLRLQAAGAHAPGAGRRRRRRGVARVSRRAAAAAPRRSSRRGGAARAGRAGATRAQPRSGRQRRPRAGRAATLARTTAAGPARRLRPARAQAANAAEAGARREPAR
nr:hypothetical protein [Lysobacter enzymogenes]